MVTAEEFRFHPTRIEWVSDQPLPLLIWNQGRERHVFHMPGIVLAWTWLPMASAKDGASRSQRRCP